MRNFILTGLFIFISINLYSTNIFLKKLIDNNYVDTAINYCNENYKDKTIQKDCISIFLKNYKYKELIQFLDNIDNSSEKFLLLYECFIKTENFNKGDLIEKKIENLILSSYQEKKFNILKKLKNALIFYSNYDYSSALKNFNSVYDNDPEILKKKILCLIYLNKIDVAQKLIKKYKIDDPFVIGLLYYKKGLYNQALVFFKKSNNPDSKIYIYNCLVLTKRFSEIQEKTNSQETFFKKIKMLIDYEKYDEALLRLKSSKECFYKYFYTGVVQLKLENFNKSINSFLKAKDFINSSMINYYIGYAYFKNQEYINSINFFKKAINIQDSFEFYSKSIFFIAKSYEKIGDIEKALKNYKKFLSLPDKFISIGKVYINIANCYKKLGEYSKAIEFYNKYYEITKDKNILIDIAELSAKEGDYVFAIQTLGNFLPVKNKKQSFILLKIADIYFKNGNYKESLKYYFKYLKFNRKNQKIFLKIGLSYLYMNDLKNAKLNFLKIVESQKRSKIRDEALYWLGLVYFKENNCMKSNIYFKRLYNANSSSFLTTQAVKYILICSIKNKDIQTFKKFIKIYPYPEDIVIKNKQKIKDFCNTQECLKLFTLKSENEIAYEIFHNINKLIAQNNLKKIIEISKLYEDYFIKNPIFYYKIGKFLIDNNLKDEGIFYLNHFLNYSFENYNYSAVKEALKNVIDYYYLKKDYQKIIYYYEKFKDITLEQKEIYFIGTSYYNLKVEKKAKEYFTIFIKNFNYKKDNLNYLFDSAFKLENIGEINFALKGYLKFLKFSKDRALNVEALYWIGDIYFKQNNLKKALEMFLKIKLLYKEFSKWSIQATFRAGNIFEKLGKKDKAIKEYKYIYYMLPKDDPRKIYIGKILRKIENEKN